MRANSPSSTPRRSTPETSAPSAPDTFEILSGRVSARAIGSSGGLEADPSAGGATRSTRLHAPDEGVDLALERVRLVGHQIGAFEHVRGRARGLARRGADRRHRARDLLGAGGRLLDALGDLRG